MTKSLETLKLENFGFIDQGFAAHYKVDPKNGHIYNFGFHYYF